MGVKQLESSFARKDLAVLVHNKLHRRKQYGLVTKEGVECQQHRREVTLVSAQPWWDTLALLFAVVGPQRRHGHTGQNAGEGHKCG